MEELTMGQLEAVGASLDRVIAEAPEGMTVVTLVAMGVGDGGHIARAAADGPEVAAAIVGMLLDDEMTSTGVTEAVYSALREYEEAGEPDIEPLDGE